MGVLKDKMIRELDIRGRDPKTKKSYIRSMENFIDHFGCNPEDLGIEEIKDYQQYLLNEKGFAPRTVNTKICGIRFFYTHVMKMWWLSDEIIKVKAASHVPVILSEEEVARMIDSIHSVFYKSILMVLYSTGMRHSELRNLTTADVDYKRMVINIRKGKGQKDRQAFLSPLTYKALRTYWVLFRSKKSTKSDHLFIPTKNSYGGELKKKLSHTAVGYVINKCTAVAGIKKKLPLIVFATHSPFTY